MVIIHGWHDSVHRKPYKLHQKTTPPKKCEFSKEVGYKVNIQKLIAFLYTNNEISERETKKKIPLTTASSTTKRMYLEINLTKEVKNLCLENYRALKKEIEEDSYKWKHIPCSCIVTINIIQMSILPKAIYRFSAIPVKMTMAYFTDLKPILQNLYGTITTTTKPEYPQQSWGRKTKLEGSQYLI